MTDQSIKKEEEPQSIDPSSDNSPISQKSGVETSFCSLSGALESGSKILEQEEKIKQLSTYVKRLHTGLKQTKEELKTKTAEVENLKSANQDLEAFVKQMATEEQSIKIDVPKIKKVDCNIVINSVEWSCIKFQDKVEWYRTELLQKALEEHDTSTIPPKSIEIPEKYDFIEEQQRKEEDKKTKAELQKQITQYVQQYEARLLKMQEQWDDAENRLREAQEQKKYAEVESQDQSEYFNKLLTDIIDQSSDIRENTILYANEEAEQSMRNEALNKMKMTLLGLQKMTFDCEVEALGDLKNHLILLHQTIYDILKKNTSLNQEITLIEKRWKSKCQDIYVEKEKEKKEKIEIVEAGRQKIKELEETLDELKTESSKQIKERDFKLDSLNKQMKKNANIEYIRNIIINFLTNPDVLVRQKLLPVVGTVLQFSSTELETTKNIWEKEHQPNGKGTVKGWISSTLFGGGDSK